MRNTTLVHRTRYHQLDLKVIAPTVCRPVAVQRVKLQLRRHHFHVYAGLGKPDSCGFNLCGANIHPRDGHVYIMTSCRYRHRLRYRAYALVHATQVHRHCFRSRSSYPIDHPVHAKLIAMRVHPLAHNDFWVVIYTIKS